ncbi:MAG TPA: BlaI/MecI/CopY family transcriptional regulator [Planctomycetaceae bacterium]|jgi:predicted transcriptional regulator|nr:BlaI/MecI/CopY family transcriptional regulator [Planctomycetaceae bacterium]
MSKRPALAKSELEVARIVWQLGEASVRQVLDALPADRNLDFKTVQTYLRRLEAKGYLRTRREGRALVYVPRVRRDQVVREVIDDLVQRLFGGDSLPLFQHLIHDRGLTDAEVEQLRALLDQWEDQKP